MTRLPASSLLCALLMAAGAACAAQPERAAQPGRLPAGIAYPVPEYKGGMKFRTPDALDQQLLTEAARRMKLTPAIVRSDASQVGAQLASGQVRLALLAIDPARAPAGTTLVPTGYVAAPMAVMRTDTDIRRWEHLKGRKVCLSEGGLYVGTLAAKYGAVEIVQRAPADSLLAVRTGACDAAVHDSAMLEELVRLPEWKKFSARLPAGPGVPLSFVVPSADARTINMLRQAASEWKSSGYLEQAMKSAVRHIAFEVYLDQDVPDCH
ncbi:transporter substrate-binding domain-containing protein [Noviherbaspirillum aridicola]|uniref:Substrate-binding protein n=1 Tax=Noviherbaspirillum aridicola TaxID=2849687 RepID=A0ABQ4Q7C4_9BURK|nr:transporter substrate-binding domain-containing protein [Noviherbaspirillum aridicola]GIZ53053.1 substrate-binding protein [Noviherbaspirillum aridicola]